MLLGIPMAIRVLYRRISWPITEWRTKRHFFKRLNAWLPREIPWSASKDAPVFLFKDRITIENPTWEQAEDYLTWCEENLGPPMTHRDGGEESWCPLLEAYTQVSADYDVTTGKIKSQFGFENVVVAFAITFKRQEDLVHFRLAHADELICGDT